MGLRLRLERRQCRGTSLIMAFLVLYGVTISAGVEIQFEVYLGKEAVRCH